MYYIGSADLMPRNLDTRVELLVPIEQPELQAELEDTLDRCLADDNQRLDADQRRLLEPPGGTHAQRAQRAD